jgi:hypothetical protein
LLRAGAAVSAPSTARIKQPSDKKAKVALKIVFDWLHQATLSTVTGCTAKIAPHNQGTGTCSRLSNCLCTILLRVFYIKADVCNLICAALSCRIDN